MPIEITATPFATAIVCAALLLGLALGYRRNRSTELLSLQHTQELKGIAILAIVFAHISYMLVTDNRFLYPLSVAAGVGVDLFLFISGFGLTLGMMKRPLAPAQFYRRRMIRLFIPFWLVLGALFVADALLLGVHYPPAYMLQSLAGWFPRASAFEDVNSPFWYISWILLHYLLFPLLYSARRPWLGALLFALLANVYAICDPLQLQANWLHRLHTNAFPLGMLLAWLVHGGAATGVVERVIRWRQHRAHVVVIGAALAGAAWTAAHNTPEAWPRIAQGLGRSGFDAGFFIGQASSLIALCALVGAFVLARGENRFLGLFGLYSYETYLLHWPLMSRYDLFYQHLPGWAATLAWLAAFLAAGWLLQRITTPLGAWAERML